MNLFVKMLVENTSNIFENEAKFDVNIYPNPSNGIFKLDLDGLNNNQIDLSVMDVSGKVVYAKSIASNSNKLIVPMNISNAEDGVYFIRISSGTTITKRIVVSRN